jgi:hypothetical protein
MRKRLSELSLRGRRVLFLSKLALLRGNAANIANSLIVRAYHVFFPHVRAERRLTLYLIDTVRSPNTRDRLQ